MFLKCINICIYVHLGVCVCVEGKLMQTDFLLVMPEFGYSSGLVDYDFGIIFIVVNFKLFCSFNCKSLVDSIDTISVSHGHNLREIWN